MFNSLIKDYKDGLYFGLELGREGYDSLDTLSKINLYNVINDTNYYMYCLEKDFEYLSGLLGCSYFALMEMFEYILSDEVTAKKAEMAELEGWI